MNWRKNSVRLRLKYYLRSCHTITFFNQLLAIVTSIVRINFPCKYFTNRLSNLTYFHSPIIQWISSIISDVVTVTPIVRPERSAILSLIRSLTTTKFSKLLLKYVILTIVKNETHEINFIVRCWPAWNFLLLSNKILYFSNCDGNAFCIYHELNTEVSSNSNSVSFDSFYLIIPTGKMFDYRFIFNDRWLLRQRPPVKPVPK